MLSAPLLIGCDISKMDDFTVNLLTNDEVLALDQDPLGKQAQQIIKKDSYQVWIKELEDGNKAIGIFNLSDQYQKIFVNWKDLGIFENSFATKVAPHGVTLIKIMSLAK